MIEYTLLNVLILELKIYCGPYKFYGRSKLGQYDEVKDRAPSVKIMYGIKVIKLVQSMISLEITVTGRVSECHLAFAIWFHDVSLFA